MVGDRNRLKEVTSKDEGNIGVFWEICKRKRTKIDRDENKTKRKVDWCGNYRKLRLIRNDTETDRVV